MVDTEERVRIYLAGHFDGEGCITFPRQGSYVQILVQHTHLETLQLYERSFGGRIYDIKPRAGLVRRKPIWTWGIGHRVDCARFLLSIEPYLIEKKETANKALRILTDVIQRGCRRAGVDRPSCVS